MAEAALALQALHYATMSESSGSSNEDTTQNAIDPISNSDFFGLRSVPENVTSQSEEAVFKEDIVFQEKAMQFSETDQQSNISELHFNSLVLSFYCSAYTVD